MAQTYEDYKQLYDDQLNKVRRFLAGHRTRSTLIECDALLLDAQNHAIAMVGIAEIEGNALRIQESNMRMNRDIQPLIKEVKRVLHDMNRQDLFLTNNNNNYNNNNNNDMERLIRSSDDLLQNSLSMCSDTEQIGTNTLYQMNQQREQLQSAGTNLEATVQATQRAGIVLRDMSRTAFRNKFVLKVFIALLVLGNGFIIYRKMVHSSKK